MADISGFVSTYAPQAALVGQKLGVDPSIVLGQWGLETGWGKSVIPGTNNLGNIKSVDGSGVAATDNMTGSRDKYAAYSSPDDFANAQVLLLSKPRYASALNVGNDAAAYFGGLSAGGYAEDPGYQSKGVAATNMVRSALGVSAQPQQSSSVADAKAGLAQQVTEDYAAGVPSSVIVNGLLKSPLAGADVAAALSKGKDPDHIVNVVGGDTLSRFKATDPTERVKQQSFGTNLVQGAGNAIDDMSLGAQQLLTNDPVQARALQAQALADQNDPTRQALSNTLGGKLGSGAVKALPTVGAVLAAPETFGGSLLALGAAGAAQGALTPTTEDGQRWGNVATEGALNVGGGVAAKGLGMLGSSAVKALTPSGEAAADATALQAQRAALGWPSTVADLNPTARTLRDALPAAKQASEDQMRRDMAGTVLGRIGQTGDEISPANVQLARSTIYNEPDALLKGVVVPADTSTIAPKLASIVSKYETDTLPTYRSPEVASAASDVLDKISSGTMSGTALVQARKNIMGNAWKADGDTKTALRAIGDAIDDHLGTVAPDVLPALQKANSQWQHLQVVENALNRVNGQGDLLTPRAFAQSVKAVNRDQFQAGTAPYQDVADAILKSQGANSSSSLAGLAAKQLGHGADGLLTGAALFEPHVGIPALVAKKVAAMLAGKAVNSDSPTAIRLLTGVGQAPMDPTLKAYISKALTGTSALVAQATM